MRAPASLTIQWTRRSDGAVVFRCIRPDGTSTWRRGENATAHFYAEHDLTHYAVETVLRCNCGFFGLVATGWDMSDFGPPWPRGPIPPDAMPVELVVGLLDQERSAGLRFSADDVNSHVADYHRHHGLPVQSLRYSEEQVIAMRARRNRLLDRWWSTPPGETLELPFMP